MVLFGRHVYGRSLDAQHFTAPAILWFAGTVMGEVGAPSIYGASTIVVGWHGYGRGRGP